MILLSLHPSPASDTSAFNKMRAFKSRCAGLFPSESKHPTAALFSAQPHHISLHNLLAPRHSPLRRSNHDRSESPNHFKLVEASD
jgi:hypothetical protein